VSKFFVGQRVRIARPDSGSRIRGLIPGDQGVIARLDWPTDVRVRVDGKVNPTGFQQKPQDDFPMFYDELEPILPDGHRTGDFTNVQDLLDSLTREHA
jgi:hypothetical protein